MTKSCRLDHLNLPENLPEAFSKDFEHLNEIQFSWFILISQMSKTSKFPSMSSSSLSEKSSKSSQKPRKFTLDDIPSILDKIFSQYDTDGNKLFSRG